MGTLGAEGSAAERAAVSRCVGGGGGERVKGREGEGDGERVDKGEGRRLKRVGERETERMAV